MLQYLQQLGPLSLFLVLLLDSVGVPLPTEIALLIAGALLRHGQFGWTASVIFTVAGFTIGCWISYRVGASVGARLVEKYGRYVGIQPQHLAKAEEWVRRYGVRAVFFGRLIPVVRSMAGYPAGAVGMPKGLYWLGSLSGYGLYCALNLFVGYKLGGQWRQLIKNADVWLWIAAVGVFLYLCFYLWRRSRKKRVESKDES